MGVRPVLRCNYGGELEIPLYHTDRFLDSDYSVFDFGCMAFIEVGFPRLARCAWPDSNCIAMEMGGLETCGCLAYKS